MYTIRPLTEADARQILTWRYDPPYHIYNMMGDDPTPADVAQAVSFLIDAPNRYFAVDDEIGDLLGYCCFGEEAQVPGYDYRLFDALDVGLGMAANKIGQGRGQAFLATILAFGRHQFRPGSFRATVAHFNLRSQRMFYRAGFVSVASFTSTNLPSQEFVVLVQTVQETASKLEPSN